MMTTAFDPRQPGGTTNAFPAADFPPAVFETVAASMMRIAEAEFALLQAITRAQLGMMEAMMRASAPSVPVRSRRNDPSQPAERRPTRRTPA